jgi:hypothetical protein
MALSDWLSDRLEVPLPKQSTGWDPLLVAHFRRQQGAADQIRIDPYDR